MNDIKVINTRSHARQTSKNTSFNLYTVTYHHASSVHELVTVSLNSYFRIAGKEFFHMVTVAKNGVVVEAYKIKVGVHYDTFFRRILLRHTGCQYNTFTLATRNFKMSSFVFVDDSVVGVDATTLPPFFIPRGLEKFAITDDGVVMYTTAQIASKTTYTLYGMCYTCDTSHIQSAVKNGELL